MSFALISFIVSGVVLVLMVGLKASIFKDRHVHPWVRVRAVSDSYIQKSIDHTSGVSQKVTHGSLLKILSLVYHDVIPVIEKGYREVASRFYKLHRKLWSFLEYSKQSTHQVSEYLHHLSEHKKNGEEGL